MDGVTAQTIDCLAKTLDHTTVKAAEQQLRQMISQQRQFPQLLLQLITQNDNNVSTPIKLQAAVTFKNMTKQAWDPQGDSSINAEDKAQVRAHLVDCMISSSINSIRNSLSESIATICEYDFPHNWPQIVQQLVQKLNTNDLNAVQGALITTHSIFKKYRSAIELTEAMVEEINEVVRQMGQPLLDLSNKTWAAVEGNVSSKPLLTSLVHIINSVLEIFYDLNCHDMAQFFEDKMKDWMGLFRACLAYNNPVLIDKDEEDYCDLPDENKALVLQCLGLYLGKFDEEFEPYAPELIKGVVQLLINVTTKPKQDQLAVAGMDLLVVCCKSMFHKLLTDDAAMKQEVCEKIIIPNCQLRESDLDMFEHEPAEYIQRDIEASDSETRRKSAFDLIRALGTRSETQLTAAFTQYVNFLMGEYSKNTQHNWTNKDTAIFLLTALAVKGATTQHGTTQVRDIVPIGAFFEEHILPELKTDPKNAPFPVLKADAIKFVSTFRVQIPASSYPSLISLLAQWLSCPSEVVYTYAAATIERMLMVRDPPVTGPFRIPASAWASPPSSGGGGGGGGDGLCGLLLSSLVGRLQKCSKPPAYIMKAINKVITQANTAAQPYVNTMAPILFDILQQVSKNPVDATFNHYLFETFTSLIKHVPGCLPALEPQFWQHFGEILTKDIADFVPYALQIFGHMLDIQQTPSDNFKQLLPPLLAPSLYENRSNIPAIVKLLCAYLKNALPMVLEGNHLGGIFGAFQCMIASKVIDHEGFTLLCQLIKSVPQATLQGYMKTVFSLLFARCQSSRTAKFMKCLCVFLAMYTDTHGIENLVQTIETVQQGLFPQILCNIWLKEVPAVQGIKERQLCFEVITKLSGCGALQQYKPQMDATLVEMRKDKGTNALNQQT
eukprot:TRINITY_DN67284_c1_g1_i1.p1 TRINITY_DN67284_c1_g1~~TRINITY_DN67284_c1_g1_i1.p1  ORF type:complete len:892 (+),score=39.73 TRINITY_DN67284_c1_g1_i1:52-2727(+)